MGIKKIEHFFSKHTSIIPLVIFRMAFGFLMCISQLRFIYNGWIKDCFISPQYHFTYQFFDFIRPFDLYTMYAIVIASALFAFFIGIGFLYRISSILFFISFTYLELIEKSWYLNHYYFASLVAFLLIWLPAHRGYSLDLLLFKFKSITNVERWTTDILKLQLAVVYLFGGIAKLKYDWLFNAQPLKIWLNARTDMPILGRLFEYDLTPYLFSWSGTLYDLFIPFLLWNRQSRPIAYVLVVVFHVLTYLLFNIGMFPWLMIAGSLIFITTEEWKFLFSKFKINFKPAIVVTKQRKQPKIIYSLLVVYLIFQFAFPLRHHFYSDYVLWTENGIRFAWHVMIMEKNGHVEFEIVDNSNQKKFTVYPSQYLSVIQEKQMSFQPDMIWQFAQYLDQQFNEKETKSISIYAHSKVSLNGRISQTYINPKIDILSISSVDAIYDHIIPLKLK